MVTENDDFPVRSDDPNLQPPPELSTGQEIVDQGDPDAKILIRLLIGTVMEGSEEFRLRARRWQVEANASRPSGMVISAGEESDASLLRYSLLGLLFQAMDAGAEGLSVIDKVSSRAYRLAARVFAPLTKSRVWRPVQNQYDSLGAKGESIVDSWINTGRREEQISRAMVRQQAYEQLVNEVIDYLAQKPEVRDLVQQQSVGMAEEIVGDVRERSSDFDSLLEEKVNTLFRRRSKR